MKFAGFMIVIFSLIFSSASMGKTITPKKKSVVSEKIINYADKTQTFISESWKTINYSVDSFFANEKYAREMNESYIKGTFYTLLYQDSGIKNDFSLQAKVDLSQATEKFKFIIEQENDLLDERRGTTSTPTGQQTTSNVSSSLRFEIVKSNDWSVSSDLGTRITLPLDPFYKLRMRRSFYFENKNSELRLVPRLEFFRQSYLNLSFGVEYHKRFSLSKSFLFANQVQYVHLNQSTQLSHIVEFKHKLSTDSALKYRLGVYANLESSIEYHTTALSAIYRKNMHENWLFGQIVPGIDFKYDRSFYNFLVSLEIIF